MRMSSSRLEQVDPLREDMVKVSVDLRDFMINLDKEVKVRGDNHLAMYLKNSRNFSQEELVEPAGKLNKQPRDRISL